MQAAVLKSKGARGEGRGRLARLHVHGKSRVFPNVVGCETRNVHRTKTQSTSACASRNEESPLASAPRRSASNGPARCLIWSCPLPYKRAARGWTVNQNRRDEARCGDVEGFPELRACHIAQSTGSRLSRISKLKHELKLKVRPGQRPGLTLVDAPPPTTPRCDPRRSNERARPRTPSRSAF